MSAAGSWPRWSLDGEPAALAKYVLPDEVAALLQLPGPPADSRIGQAQAVYEALAGASITYSHEAPGDDPGRQAIRQPGEVLWCPRHATCLDLALILAGACLHAGLHPLVLILDPPQPGRAAHALLGVWIDDVTPDEGDGIRMPDADVWTSRPDGFDDLVQTDPTGPSRPLLLLDPVGAAHALPHSPILGTSAAFADAVHAGARYGREWSWRLAVDIRRTWRKQDTHTPAVRPDDPPLRPPYVALDPLVHRPLQVLRAEHAVVPFQARDELTILTDWCHTVATGPYTGVTVIHGAGGAGKTRLALELAHQLATRHGWYTGYLREHPAGRDWLGTIASPTLIVLDYADARTADAEHLLAILKRRTDRGAAPAVVVMTARAVNGQWLTTLRTAWTRDGHLVRESEPLHLPSEHPAGAALFRRAARAFHHAPDHELDLEAADRAAPAAWTTLDHILLALLAARSSGRLPTTREALYEEVLTHERAYWAQAYKKNTSLGRDADAPLDVLNRAVASLTLRAPTTRKEIHTALRAVEELSDDAAWRETIRTTLATCLQPGPGEPLVLRPDPIADHLTLHELHDDEDLLPAILDGLDDDRLLAALRQLNRAATTAPDSAARMVKAWINAGADRWQPVLRVAAEQGGTALAALEQLIDHEPAVPWLGDLSDAIPFTTIGLPELGLRTDLRRLSVLRADDTTQPADLAELLQRTSHRQFAAGDRQGALASIREAVDHYRALAEADPAACLPNLAMSLNNLSNQQGETGDRQGALVSIREAVEIRRALAEVNAAAYLPDLAMSLNNLSVQQGEMGDRQGALVSIGEAVDHYRALAQANAAAYLPDLAMSLNNLSVQQSGMGDRQGALVSIREAVDHYRALAQANPAAYIPYLAMSLNNLSNRQSETGDWQGALVSISEAVEIRRALAEANAVAYLPDLAMSLNDLSNRLSGMGDRQGALVSIGEAVDHYRAVAEANAAAYLPDLAGSLNNLSNQQGEMGDRQGALVSIREAVDHYRALAEANAAAYIPNLAGSLNNLSVQQSEMGDRQGALVSIREAVDHYRALAQANPAAFLPNLAGSLNNLSVQQSETEVASSAWEDAITGLEVSPLAQAELRSHYAAYLAAHGDVSLAVEQLVRAAQACVVGDRSPLSRARQQVWGTATSLGIKDPRLPDWAVDPLPDDVLVLLSQWARATDWPTTEAFLHAHADRLRQPDFRGGLELAAALFPESPDIGTLTDVLDQVDAEGVDAVVDRGRHDHEVRQTLYAWIATPTWTESKDFLDRHDSTLRTPEVQALLAGTDTPEARRHLAVLQLTEALSYDQVYEILTDPDIAAEHAFAAVDRADVPLMRRVLAARPDLLTGITGAFFATVSAVAGGDTGQARQLAQAIADRGTDTQRRAYAIRLRTLAGLAPALAGAGELADLLQPDDHS